MPALPTNTSSCPNALDGCADGGLVAFDRRNVRFDGDHSIAERLCERCEPLRVDVRDADAVAFGDEPLDDGTPDTARTSRNQRDFVRDGAHQREPATGSYLRTSGGPDASVMTALKK